MKKIAVLFLLSIFYINILAADNLSLMKEKYKLVFMEQAVSEKSSVIGIADRLEADALLELADEKYIFYSDYVNSKELELRKSNEILLIMPRVDIFKKHINSLAKTTENIFVFFMEGDKLGGTYGDRSYETYLKSDLEKKLPKNVKVFKLKNESVTDKGKLNNFEFSDIQNSLVFKNQIMPIYKKVSKIISQH